MEEVVSRKKIDKALLTGEKYKPFFSFWEAQCALLPEPFVFAGNRRSAEEGFGSEVLEIASGTEFYKAFTGLVNSSDLGILVMLSTGFCILSGKYTGLGSIALRTPLLGDSEARFSSEVVIIQTLHGSETVRDLLVAFRQTITQSYKYQDFPLEVLEHTPGNSPERLSNVWLSYQGQHSPVPPASTDLNIYINRSEAGLTIDFHYRRNLFGSGFIRNLSGHFARVLQYLINPDTCIKDISILSPEEEKRILYRFNETETSYPRESTIARLFEEQAARYPANTAVAFGSTRLTYGELNKAANRLAHHLRSSYDIRPDDLVGLMLDRSEQLIVCLLGILKAGAAYLPLDSTYPRERIKLMLDNAKPRVLLVQSDLMDALEDNEVPVFVTDIQLEMLYEPETNPEPAGTAGSLAYVMYTSGSTGVPKGVLIEQRSVVRLVKNTNYIEIEPSDKILQTGPLSFDASTFEIWGALLNGASVHLVEKSRMLDMKKLQELMEKEQISKAWFTSSYFNELADNHPALFGSLNTVLVGGDKLSPYHINKIRSAWPGLRIINGYGPTENTTFTACFEIDGAYESGIPIGFPVANTRIYILNNDMQPVPVGVTGEVYAAGDGLARGYLNNEALTAERFIPSPFRAGERLYRTGDLGCWNEAGYIEFMGRKDNQVKVRGYRIELEEIIHAISRHEGVREATVVLRKEESGKSELAAYFTADSTLESLGLKTFLGEKLPGYMIPSYFLKLEKFPLTVNGKINKDLLPDPRHYGESASQYVAPRTETEKQLAIIWEEVLDVKKVGVNDNFFDLGGHSLKATSLVSRIYQVFHVEVPLNELFSNPGLGDTARYIDSASKTHYIPIPQAGPRTFYPVSSAQKRMFVLNSLEGDGVMYNVPFFTVIEGRLDREKVKAAFRSLIRRHESLRTGFEIEEGEPVQYIRADVPFTIEQYRSLEEDIDKVIGSFVRPFDLSVPPLMRVGLVEISEERHLLMFDIHHIISDGVSTGIIVKDFIKLYESGTLEELPVQYKDFAVWHNDLLGSARIKEQELYWLRQFADGTPVLNLPADFPRPAFQSFEGDSLSFLMSKEETERLHTFCKQHDVTLYMLLLASLNVLLSRYSGQDDLVIGSPIAARLHPDLQEVLGMFVNTLAMRNRPAPDKSFAAFLEEVKENALNAYKNQDYPFEMLVGELDVNRDVSRSALFDVMFVLQNEDMGTLETEGLRFIPYRTPVRTAKFDLLFGAGESATGELEWIIEYSTALFRKETVERMAGHLRKVIAEAISQPDGPISGIDILTPSEKKCVTGGFNAGYIPVGEEAVTLHKLVEEQAQRTPDKPALIFGENAMSYRELNEKANRLAAHLRKSGAGEDVVVGLLMERSSDLVVSMLAVLKSGAAYLPIDTSYPAARIGYMLEDSRAWILLTDDITRAELSGINVINIKDVSLYTGDHSNPGYPCRPSSLAYLIYTSGSTGLPKGVAIEHRNVVSFLSWCKEEFKDSSYEVVYAVTPCSFDLSVFEIFFGLLSGRPVRVLPSALDIAKFLSRERGVLLNTVPSVIAELVDKKADISNASVINMAGEPVPEKVKRALDYGSAEVRNLYGPSECTTYSTCFRYTCYTEEDNIGRPLSNTLAYVLDSFGNPLPVGVPGELCLSGKGVARGYLFRDELTRQRFFPDPFSPGNRIYRTSDLARWNQDGTLVFLGRLDHQVKIRGHRIELGEIERRLLDHGDVEHALVTDSTGADGERFLCAYVSGKDMLPDTSILREHLAVHLPSYMIPAHIVSLESFPLTPNGKINRSALPDPLDRAVSQSDYIAPVGPEEEYLVSEWKDLLGVQEIGVTDNFFELGGHSLKATVLLARIQGYFGVDIPLREMFRHPTVRGLSALIQQQGKSCQEAIVRTQDKARYTLSLAQKRLYIIDRMGTAGTSYNMPFVLRVEGEIDRERLETAFRQIIRRHESLRTSFMVAEGEPFQQVHEELSFGVMYEEAPEDKLQALIGEFIKPFDLSQAPLIRVKLVRTAANNCFLLCDMHHIVSDGVSIGVITRELAAFYGGETLEPLALQYKDYADWQQAMLKTTGYQAQAAFWKDQFRDEIPVLHLPSDFPRPAVRSFRGSRLEFSFGEELSSRLKKFARQSDTTVFTVLLAIYKILLSKYSSQEDLVVGIPVSGRTQPGLEPLVGMFVNTLALRTQPEGEKAFRRFLDDVQQQFLRAFENQDYPVEELVNELNVARDMSRNPLFDVMFAYQKGDEHSLDIRGLSFTAEDFSTGISKFDITLNVIDGEAKICFSLEYCTDLFSHDTILRMARHFENIAGQVLKNPAAALSQIETVLPEEKQQLLHEFNPLPVSYPENETVLDLLKRQANTFPSHIAVRCKDEELTYAELDSRSGRLAALLHEKGAGPESIVGILLDRSTDMIVAIWAVLKAGAAYVPIDSSYPPERIGYLLSDSGAQALLTHSAYAGRNDYSGTLILIDACETSACSPDFCAQVKGSQLAYVVYTSGSTGNPKGVMIEHSSLHDYVHTFIRYFSLSSADTVLYQTSVSFDTTMEAIFPVLCVGGKLVIHKNNRDLSAIPRLIKENGVTLLSTTPIVIDYLNSHSADLSPLRALLSGGEVLKPAHIDRLIGQMEIFNGYGPSESTVCTSFHKVEKLVPNISIGRPIANRQVYILNGHNSLQPVGVVGELCIGGPGLARGYLNQPALTGKKFPPNPFMPGTRMYKTGDLARWLPDGTLEFTGRKDNQVKIRGFRVELGEIEKTLLRHPGIHEALVVATEVRKNETDLVAYVVTRQEIAGADIRAHLENLLPNYMIPSYFVIMDNIPLTTNGKTDYKALPLPDPEGNRSVEFIEPATETEKNLAGIWKEVLGLSKVGIHDNFFQLGGNSLKIIRLLKLIDNLYPDMVKVNDLFDFATISQLANVIKERTSPGSSGMETPAAKPQKVKF